MDDDDSTNHVKMYNSFYNVFDAQAQRFQCGEALKGGVYGDIHNLGQMCWFSTWISMYLKKGEGVPLPSPTPPPTPCILFGLWWQMDIRKKRKKGRIITYGDDGADNICHDHTPR